MKIICTPLINGTENLWYFSSLFFYVYHLLVQVIITFAFLNMKNIHNFASLRAFFVLSEKGHFTALFSFGGFVFAIHNLHA